MLYCAKMYHGRSDHTRVGYYYYQSHHHVWHANLHHGVMSHRWHISWYMDCVICDAADCVI